VSGKSRSSAKKNVQVLEIREAVQNQAKQDFSQKPVNSGDQDLVIAEGFRYLCSF
jgi:hypothetical protein